MVDCVEGAYNNLMPPVKYEKSNTFKNIGSFVGAAALIPATLRAAAKSHVEPDVFVKFIKNGPSLMDFTLAETKNGFAKKLYDDALILFKKSKCSRIAAVAFGLTAVTALYMSAGRLLGAIPDAIINKVREHKAQKPQVIY